MIGNTPAQLAITIDIEDWYHIPSVCGSPFSVYHDVDDFFRNWNEPYDYLTEPTRRVLALLREYNIQATFFIVADVAQHYPGLIESIVENGHEIACHGLHHTCKIDPATKKPLMDRETFEKQTRQAKSILEKITGTPVIGYRAPNALIAGWMLDSLEDLGFLYDSSVSVNSLYNKTDSPLSGVTTCPYYPRRHSLEPIPDPRGIVEFPFAYYDARIKIPASGGPMLRFLGGSLILQGLQQSLKRGTTIFYFHPIDISTVEFPRVGKGRPLYWLIKGKIVEDRIRYILKKITEKGIKVKPLRSHFNGDRNLL
jgi:peptidoglycan/xylan/chitin deacetylase (PgdA/CDA1 family)